MRSAAVTLLLAAAVAAGLTATASAKAPLNSVVKVFTVHSSPDYSRPWQNLPEEQSICSGCVIKGKRILTNAHAVFDHAYVTVKKESSPQKYPAKVDVVGGDCDLAILTVDAPGFFDDLEPLELAGDLPNVQKKVSVLGYPTGGDAVSVTEGVVSRFEMQRYGYSDELLLVMQIDAAVNPGNSGGPVLVDGKMAGIAFENLNEAQSIAYAIPLPVIRRFLADVARIGKLSPLGWMGIIYQNMENDQLRAYKKMKPDQSGVIVTRITQASDAQLLKPGDVLMSIDRVAIANDGTVPLRRNERVDMRYLCSQKAAGESVQMRVLRDGAALDLEMVLQERIPLVPLMQFNIAPSYFIHAGLTFIPLTFNYIAMATGGDPSRCPPEFETLLNEGQANHPDEQVVILSTVLADDVNMGYETYKDLIVAEVNGSPIRNLADLCARIEANTNAYLVIEFASKDLLVLDRARAKQATERILRNYRIPADRSADL